MGVPLHPWIPPKSATGLTTVWKALLEHIVDQKGSDTDSDVDEIASGGIIVQKMLYRVCGYEHYQTLDKSLLSNLKKLLGISYPSHLTTALRDSEFKVEGQLFLHKHSVLSSASPDVTVYYLHFYV